MRFDSEQYTLLNAMTPGVSLRSITKDDDNDLPDGVCKGVYVGTQGNLAVICKDDTSAVTLVAAVGWLPIRAKRVLSTGTTAAGLVAVY
jgi:hypothetical protein